jgi:hypothetical protein
MGPVRGRVSLEANLSSHLVAKEILGFGISGELEMIRAFVGLCCLMIALGMLAGNAAAATCAARFIDAIETATRSNGGETPADIERWVHDRLETIDEEAGEDSPEACAVEEDFDTYLTLRGDGLTVENRDGVDYTLVYNQDCGFPSYVIPAGTTVSGLPVNCYFELWGQPDSGAYAQEFPGLVVISDGQTTYGLRVLPTDRVVEGILTEVEMGDNFWLHIQDASGEEVVLLDPYGCGVPDENYQNLPVRAYARPDWARNAEGEPMEQVDACMILDILGDPVDGQWESHDDTPYPGDSCQPMGIRPSVDGGAKAEVLFHNQADYAAYVLWADQRGDLRDMALLQPGESVTIDTVQTHTWYVEVMAPDGPSCFGAIWPFEDSDSCRVGAISIPERRGS